MSETRTSWLERLLGVRGVAAVAAFVVTFAAAKETP